MRNWPLLLVALLSGCILGQARSYSLQEDLSDEEVAHLRALAEEKKGENLLEQRVYSIPILPLVFGFRATTLVEAPGFVGKGYSVMEMRGLLFTVLYGGMQAAVYDPGGTLVIQTRDHAVLLGFLYRGWSTSSSLTGEDQPPPSEGFSIAWGLLKKERKGDKVRWTFLWIL